MSGLITVECTRAIDILIEVHEQGTGLVSGLIPVECMRTIDILVVWQCRV